MSREQDPIQAQLIAARRNQILVAATKVFAEKGFARATIKEIAREAGIADGTIYIYFKNKHELMLGLMHRLNQSDQRAEDLSQAVEPEGFSADYFRQRLHFMGEHMQAFQAILQEVLGNEALRKEYYEQVVEPTFTIAEPFFGQMIAEGAIRPFDPALSMRVLTGTALGVMLLRILGDPVTEEKWDELPGVIFDILFGGLEAPKGDK